MLSMNVGFITRLLLAFSIACVCALSCHADEEITTFKNCILVKNDWSDGDSFQIKTADGELHTIRLYGADCIEWHVNDDTDARRLRAQRRYFGISEWGGSSSKSIEIAKGYGKTAFEEISALLKKPFQVHTVFSDARGDGRHKRIYAFATTSEGEDLAEHLVRSGLARAYGVYRETPDKKNANDYRALLQDVELKAAKGGVGIWSKTNWDLLLAEREAERNENRELAIATEAPKIATGTQMDPNTATADELMLLPGVGEVTAKRIIQSRPYRKVDDLLHVEGIGKKTLEQLKPFLAFPSQKKK